MPELHDSLSSSDKLNSAVSDSLALRVEIFCMICRDIILKSELRADLTSIKTEIQTYIPEGEEFYDSMASCWLI